MFIKMLVPISKHTVVGWVFGSIFGLSVSLLTINLIQHPNYKWSILHKSDKSAFHGHAHSHRDLEDEVGPDDIVVFHKNDSVHHHKDEDLVAREMAGRVRVLCWVMTQPENHRSKVRWKKIQKQNIKKLLTINFLGSPREGHLGKKMQQIVVYEFYC